MVQAHYDDPVEVSPDIFEVLLENDRVRMLRATFAPGSKEQEHGHPANAVYVEKGGRLRIHDPDGASEVVAGDP